ncbi:MAG: hypothetical protein DMG32_20400 [Acidobacteria bacterium]|nr:MAG: hypothetical protein DMG32_20400 [Acidobacteriota bacterium]
MKPEPVLYTFHKIREQSEQGSTEAWRALLDFYCPLFFQLLDIHGAIPARDAPPIVKKMLAELTANGFERLRATPRQSEREFLGDLRALLLGAALDSLASKKSEVPGSSAFDADKISKLLDGLPLLHKEMLFFKLAGYTEKSLERVMRISPRVAEKAFERLAEEYQAARQSEHDRCPWPAAWLAFLKQARALKTEKCIPAHEIVRIHDGQVSWYDKEPVEKHVSGCLHCLEAWTGLREVGYWRRAADPLSSSEIDDLLQILPIEKLPAKKKSLLQRLRS